VPGIAVANQGANQPKEFGLWAMTSWQLHCQTSPNSCQLCCHLTAARGV